MFPPWLRIQRFLPCCGNHCTRSIGRGKETFGAVWEPLGTAQTPSRAVSLLFQHNLLAQLLEQILAQTAQAQLGLYFTRAIPEYSAQNSAENAPGSSYQSTLKTSGGYFGEGTDSGAWYTEGFTVFLFKDYFAFLCHKIKTLWLIFYTECLQNVWANLMIYLFFKLDYLHSDSFFNSKNPRIFYKYKAPEWHCWLGLMHIEPPHCFKENLKKKKKKPPREATKIHQSSPKLSRSASLEISRHFTESTQWCCQLVLDGTFCFKKLFYNLQPGWFVFFFPFSSGSQESSRHQRSVSTAQRGFKEGGRFSNSSSGCFRGVQECFTPPLMHYYSLGTGLCCSLLWFSQH